MTSFISLWELRTVRSANKLAWEQRFFYQHFLWGPTTTFRVTEICVVSWVTQKSQAEIICFLVSYLLLCISDSSSPRSWVTIRVSTYFKGKQGSSSACSCCIHHPKCSSWCCPSKNRSGRKRWWIALQSSLPFPIKTVVSMMLIESLKFSAPFLPLWRVWKLFSL